MFAVKSPGMIITSCSRHLLLRDKANPYWRHQGQC
jgi:hypothetical protein